MSVPSSSRSPYSYIVPSTHPSNRSSNHGESEASLAGSSQAGPPRVPEIVNPDALKYANRRKILDTSGKGVFNAVHSCLKTYADFDYVDYEKIADRFKDDNEELFEWILNNGPKIRKDIAEHGKVRNKELAKKVREALLWFPLAAMDDGKPLHPESACALLRKLRKENYSAEEIVSILTKNRNFLRSLTGVSFQDLHAAVPSFSEEDHLFDINDQLFLVINSVYLLALELENKPLTPEIVCQLLHSYLCHGFGTEDIAVVLQNQKHFLLSLNHISLEQLYNSARELSEKDTLYSGVFDYLIFAIDRIYLLALELSEAMNLLLEFEEMKEEFPPLLISRPSYWNEIVGSECSSWETALQFFEEVGRADLPSEPGLLQREKQKLHFWMIKLSELDKARSLNEDPMKFKLLFLTEKAFLYDASGQSVPTFPACIELLPKLFSQLDSCREEFVRAAKDAIKRRLAALEGPLPESNPAELEVTIDVFSSIFMKELLEAGCTFLFHGLQYSRNHGVAWDLAVQTALESALKQTPELPKGDLMDTLSYKSKESEQFLYCFSSEYLGMDPIELMQQAIKVLPKRKLETLFENMQASKPEGRSTILINFLKLQIPKNLLALKTKFISQQG